MPHIQQAKKRLRQTERRTAMNRGRRSRLRTYVRKVEEAIASGNQDAARAALKAAEPEVMRSCNRGILKRNTASRTISRLTRRVNGMNA
jgi:small subunit ribosomal protein S20